MTSDAEDTQGLEESTDPVYKHMFERKDNKNVE